jgi:hypothetical protein
VWICLLQNGGILHLLLRVRGISHLLISISFLSLLRSIKTLPSYTSQYIIQLVFDDGWCPWMGGIPEMWDYCRFVPYFRNVPTMGLYPTLKGSKYTHGYITWTFLRVSSPLPSPQLQLKFAFVWFQVVPLQRYITNSKKRVHFTMPNAAMVGQSRQGEGKRRCRWPTQNVVCSWVGVANDNKLFFHFLVWLLDLVRDMGIHMCVSLKERLVLEDDH